MKLSKKKNLIVSAAASSSSLASPAALPSHLLPRFPSRSSPAAGPRWRSGTRWRSRSSPSHLRRRHSLGVEIRCWEDQLLTERIEIFVFSSAPLLDHATRAAAHQITRLRLYACAPAAGPYLPAAAGPPCAPPTNPRRAATPSSHRALLAPRTHSPLHLACASPGPRAAVGPPVRCLEPARRGTTCVPPASARCQSPRHVSCSPIAALCKLVARTRHTRFVAAGHAQP